MMKAIILLFILLLSNIPTLYYGWYITFSWVDIIQHFLGGFFIAMLMAIYLRDHILKKAFLRNMLIVVGATIFIGVVWEFSEYIANQTLIEPFYRWFEIRAYFMGDLQDTVYDLLMDILGALAFFACHSLWGRKAHETESRLENQGNSGTQ